MPIAESRPVPEDDKKTTLELIDSLRELRSDMAKRRDQLHTANNELFKTVGDLSLEQLKLADAQRELAARMTGVEEGIQEILREAKVNGRKAETAVQVSTQLQDTAQSAAGTSRQAVIENRVGVAVLGIIGLIIQYLTNHH